MYFYYSLTQEQYGQYPFSINWQLKTSSPSPKLAEKIKFASNRRIEIDNDDLMPNTKYTITAYHS